MAGIADTIADSTPVNEEHAMLQEMLKTLVLPISRLLNSVADVEFVGNMLITGKQQDSLRRSLPRGVIAGIAFVHAAAALDLHILSHRLLDNSQRILRELSNNDIRPGTGDTNTVLAAYATELGQEALAYIEGVKVARKYGVEGDEYDDF